MVYLRTRSQKKSWKLSEVIGRAIRGTGVGVEVHTNLVPWAELSDENLAGHGVWIVVGVVLVVQTWQLISIPPDRDENFLLILGANCQGEKIEPRYGHCKYPSPEVIIHFIK